jgi:hypothetical protein
MKSLPPLALHFLAAVVAPTAGAAESATPPTESTKPISGWGATHENDLWVNFASNQDRNYTGSLGVWVSGPFVRQLGLTAPLDWLDARILPAPFPLTYEPEHASVRLLLSAFTPDDLNTTQPVKGDRPYASLVGISVRQVGYSNKDRVARTSQFVVGALGLDYARRLQTKIHQELRHSDKDVTPYDPLGWPTQISNGGEPTLLYRFQYLKKLDGHYGIGVQKEWQAVGGYEVNLGYYTNAALVFGGRWGSFTSEFWEFSDGDMGVGNKSNATKNQEISPNPPLEYYFFAEARARLVGYNALLQGQFRDRAAYHVTPEPLLGEWALGFAIDLPRKWPQVVWTLNAGRTPEFKGSQARIHTWGAVAVNFGKN